jgi:hypothetical protein
MGNPAHIDRLWLRRRVRSKVNAVRHKQSVAVEASFLFEKRGRMNKYLIDGRDQPTLSIVSRLLNG